MTAAQKDILKKLRYKDSFNLDELANKLKDQRPDLTLTINEMKPDIEASLSSAVPTNLSLTEPLKPLAGGYSHTLFKKPSQDLPASSQSLLVAQRPHI